jgi:drug/metabolite transporter (DMT)-like permease
LASTTAAERAILTPNPLTGIALKIGAVLVFLVMSSLLKATEDIPAGEMVFFRSFFALPPVLAFTAWRGELRGALRTPSVLNHFWRGLAGTFAMGLGFAAIILLPLPESVTLNYATPLIIVVLSALILKEPVHAYRWTAVIVGFVGVVIIAWPRLTLFTAGVDAKAGLGVAAAMLACVSAAIAMLLVRRLVKYEKSATIVLYFSMTSTLLSLLTIPFGWAMPTPLQAVYLVGAGLCGGIAQILMTESYRHADMSVIAPFEYSSLIFSIIIGFVFFNDVPTWQMLVGGVIVVGSGLFIIYREHRLGLDRAKAGEVSTPQG